MIFVKKNEPNQKTGKHKARRQQFIMPLEPRIMFDAAAVATVDAAVKNEPTDGSSKPTTELTAPVVHHEVAFVDSALQNSKELLSGLDKAIEVVALQSGKDPLKQISDYLASHNGISALHLFSHGTPGSVRLGDTELAADTLSDHAQQLESWKQSLTADADILLYGCDVAAGSRGESFITQLASLTGADVAASIDPTGASSKGGDWDLESKTGSIEAATLTVAGYDTLLTAPVNTVPGAQTVAEDNSKIFSGTISIADAENSVSSVNLSVSHGTLTLSGTTGLTLSGDGTASISITAGTIDNINSALNGLVYRPAQDYSGADTLTIATSDGTTTDTDTIGITVTANATAPVLTLPTASQTVAEDTATYLNFTGSNAITLTDADANDLQTLTLSVAHGTLTIKTDVAGGITSATSNGTGSVVLSGTAAQLSATLADSQGVRYTSNLNYNSSAGLGAESISFALSDGVGAHNKSGTVAINVTQVNDAPDLGTGSAATVQEGSSVSFSRNQLASSDFALDVDIQTGQQVINQLMVKIDTLPTKGTLTYNSGAVVVGSVIPVTSLGSLSYTHNGTDITSNQNDSFNVTVSDGGGGATSGAIGITITPKNLAPTISGSPSLIEGQVKVVAPAINLGDGFDTLANSTIVIDNVVTGSQGTLFIDADNDNVVDGGEALSGSTTLDATQRTNLATQLKFFQNGYEPNTPAAVSPSYRITVTDAGGGTGVPSAAIAQTITLRILPNNDDPTLANTHATVGTAQTVQEGNIVPLDNTMLKISDADLNPANTAQNTPSNQLVYTIATRPTQGEIQLYIGGVAGYGGTGWITLGDGGRFTQAQVDALEVRYYQTVNVADGAATIDGFTFTVRDSAFGYDVWTDPANPTSNREGGLRATLTGAIATQQFYLSINPLANSTASRTDLATDTYEGGPRDATPGYGTSGTSVMTYSFEPTGGMLSNNSIAAGTWVEANVGAAGGGYIITSGMLSYTITRTDNNGTPGDTGDDISVIVPPEETVYTLTSQPPNGTVQSNVSGTWQAIPVNGQFTQADIAAGKIRFVHDGGENHAASFGYTVSDGTPNHYTSTFGLDITPTNDQPTASGGSVQVLEQSPGNDGLVRLTTSVLGMGDVDLSQDIAKRVGEGAQDFLWFKVIAQPVDGGAVTRGELQRWNGTNWVAVTPGEWLPSTLLTMTADGAASGLRYAHDGSEPLAYSGGPNVTFQYQVRDDLANPGDPLSTSADAVADSSGSAQSNQSANATATIKIIPVNNAPQIADKPADADPTIGGTIASGGALTGVNNPLLIAYEGGDAVITSAMLTGIDSDNTTVQRQYILKVMPTQGWLYLSNKLLGVGSTFTQDDIDNSRVTYRHNGSELGDPTIDPSLGTYHDKFHFVLSDAISDDTGAGASDYNTFLITLTPTNDAPTVTGPSGTILIDSADADKNPVSGFTVADPDLTDNVLAGVETDFVQVTVRLLDSAGNPITNYAAVPGYNASTSGVTFGYATPADTTGLWKVTQDGINNILQIQGKRAQVNAALAGLSVTFANDANSMYKVQVIADDRMRDGAGALATGGSDANGGELNQGTTAGAAPTAVPGTVYNWATAVAVPAADPNISAATVDIRASRVNETPTFNGPVTVTVNEDVRSQVTGSFVISDPESAAFGTPVTVTVSVPSGHGTLGVGTSGAQTSITPSGGQSVTISGDNTLSITLIGRAADIQALLNGRNFANSADDGNGGLFYTGASNVNHDVNGGGAADDVTLTLALLDTDSMFGSDTGSGSESANPANITSGLVITAINDAPSVNRTATAVTIAGTTATAVSGFSITDLDSTDGYADGETDGVIQATVRILNGGGTPLAAADYTTLGITLDTSAAGHGATVDSTLTGSTTALEVRGTLTQINAYLLGLQVTFANLGSSNLDSSYSVEVIADDRLRDGSGVLTSGANGGANNQQVNLPVVPATDSFDPYATLVPAYAVYDVTSHTRPLFISSINDPGIITATNVTVNEGTATLVLNASNANIILADPDDNGSTTISATVTVSKGTITAVGSSGGSVAGLNTATVTITGATETQLNARLKALTVTYPDPVGDATSADWNGNFTVTVVYNDNGNTGTRPVVLTGDTNDATANPGDFDYADGVSNILTTTRTFTVTVNGVNDAPIRTTATVSLPTAATEDTDGDTGKQTVTALFGGAFSDAKDSVTDGSSAGSMAGVAITTNNAIAGQGKWQYSTDGSAWFDLPAVSTNSAFLLKNGDYLRFDPADNFHGTPGSLSVRLVDDSSGAITTGTVVNVTTSGSPTRYSDSSNAVTLTTTVTNVNDRPSATATTLLATTEDLANPPGALISVLGFGYSDATDNQTATSGGANAATSFGGIAIVGNAADSTTQGIWQYKDNVGGGWVTIDSAGSAPTDTAALILPTTASLRFLPNVANYNGNPGTLTVRVADSAQVLNTSSDISATLADQTSTWSSTKTLSTTVSPQNDAPTLTHTATNPTVTENASTGAATSIDPVTLLNAGALADLDLDSTAALSSTVFGGGSITVTLTDGIAGDVLQLNGTPAGVSGVPAGGSGNTAFVITLANTATLTEVEAILLAIQYKNTSDNPTLYGTDLSRAYTVVVNDGNNVQAGGNAGGPSALATPTINGTITLVATNDPPIATNDTHAVTEDSGLASTGNAITGIGSPNTTADSDPDNVIGDLSLSGIRAGTEAAGGAMTAITAGTTSANGTSIVGSYGTLTIGADGSYSYELNNSNPAVNALQTGETLSDNFAYTLKDTANLTDVAQITITINGHTDGGSLAISPVDGNAGATGDATVHEAGLTTVADIRETTTGTILADAPDGIKSISIGGTSFTIAQLQTFSIGSPSAIIDTGEGELRVTGINPTAGPAAAPTSAEVSYTYTLKATINNTNPADTESTDTIALIVTDNSASAATATSNLVIQIVDDTPTANPDTNSITKGSATVTGNVVTTGAGTDRIGADTTATPVSALSGGAIGTALAGSYGSLTLASDGSYTYALDNANLAISGLMGGQTKTDTFNYTITDADGDTSSTTVTITINGVTPNLLPVAVNDSFDATEDTPLNGTLVANDTPSGDGGNVWTKTSIPAHGTVSVNADGAFTYTPVANYHGADSFTYTITDVNGDTSTATVTLNIASLNDVPLAVNDDFTTNEDTPLTGTLTGNDTASGDGGNIWTKTSDPAHGTVTVNADGTFIYTPPAGYHGPDSFSYTITDANGDTSTATVTLNIASLNDVPLAVNDSFTTNEDAPLTGTLTGNDTASGDGGNIWSKTSDPAHGTVVVNADGTFTYTPIASYHGTDSFSYTITDANGDTSTAMVTLDITSVNDVPLAVNDSFTTNEDTPLIGTLTGNDTASGDGGNIWTKTSDPAHGTVTVNADGTFTYTPVASYHGTDSFSYTITDADGDTSTATILISVTTVPVIPEPPAPPVVTEPSVVPPAGVPQTHPGGTETDVQGSVPYPLVNPAASPDDFVLELDEQDILRGSDIPIVPGTSGGVVSYGDETAFSSTEYTLYLVKIPSSQEALVEEIATFSLPTGTFRHSSSNAKVTLEAALTDGRPLPGWLSFDPDSGRFTGKPPAGTGGNMDIKIMARDDRGNVAFTQFLLHITELDSKEAHTLKERLVDQGGNEADFDPQKRVGVDKEKPQQPKKKDLTKGRPSLTEQFSRQQTRGKNADLMKALQKVSAR